MTRKRALGLMVMLVTQIMVCFAQESPTAPSKVVFQKKIADTESLIVSRRELPPLTKQQFKVMQRAQQRKTPDGILAKPDHHYTYTLRLHRTAQGSIRDQVLWSRTLWEYDEGKSLVPSHLRVLDVAFSQGIVVVVYKITYGISAQVRRYPQTNGVRRATFEDEIVVYDNEAEGQISSAAQAIISPDSKVEVLVSFSQNQRRRFLWHHYKWVEQKSAPIR